MRARRSRDAVHVEDMVSAPSEPDRDRMRDSFFVSLGKLTLGLVRGQPWRVRAGPLTLHEFGEPAPTSGGWCWPIRGGLLTRRPGGYLSFQWRSGHLVSIVDGYWPSLPRPLYKATQLQLHHLITRLFLLQLRGRVPPPGIPGGPAQRLAAATLDVAFCSALTLALARRRRLPAWLAVTAGYHAAAWSIRGQTLGGKALGLRVVAVDGGRVTPVQAVLRMAGLPVALARFRAAHDELALTEVVETDS